MERGNIGMAEKLIHWYFDDHNTLAQILWCIEEDAKGHKIDFTDCMFKIDYSDHLYDEPAKGKVHITQILPE